MEKTVQRKCSNCYYFTRHYVIILGTELSPANCGTCRKIDGIKKHKKATCGGCKQWKELIDETTIAIPITFSYITKQIKDLAMIINCKEKYQDLD